MKFSTMLFLALIVYSKCIAKQNLDTYFIKVSNINYYTFYAAVSGSSNVKRDIKDDLLAKAVSLEKSINEAITLLTTAGKRGEVAILNKEETRLQTLANQLKVATTVTEILKLETELNKIEIRIEAELKKAVGGGFI